MLMMNEMVGDMKGFDSIRHVERRLYNIQTNNLRATAAFSNIVFQVRALRVKVDLHLRWLTTENFKITKH